MYIHSIDVRGEQIAAYSR